MTETRTARPRSRRRAAWASMALAVTAAVGVPGTASAATPPSAGTGAGSTSQGSGCALPSPDAPAAVQASGALTWAPPALTDPTTIRITRTTGSVKLKAGRDYVLRLPSTPLRLTKGLNVYGGRNVVLIGGEIDASGGRAMYFHQQSGTVHVEGVRVTGEDVKEGINVAETAPKAVVQIQNVKIDQVNGSYRTHHADLLQVWAGPSKLRVDRFEGASTYQGFFFQPTQFRKVLPDVYDLRNVVLRDASRRSAYLLWQSARFPIRTQGVVVVRNPRKPFPTQVMWPKNGRVWAGVTEGDSATPSPLTGEPGTGYRSPGYQAPGAQGAPPRA